MRVGNGLTDVTGLRWGMPCSPAREMRSGTTSFAPPGGAAGRRGRVRGAAPRHPRPTCWPWTGDRAAGVTRDHAVRWEYGLDAASGVMARLERDGEGFFKSRARSSRSSRPRWCSDLGRGGRRRG
ncbi:hypothetical protein HBB16_18350 [Pseudonocardia sp. MCCB 268]|nr:hypothetical protein [Pseudonocardia cytotoxica]